MTGKPPEHLRLDRMATPIGDALIVTDEAGSVRALDWDDRKSSMMRLLRLHYGSMTPEPGAAPAKITRTLRDYFEGNINCLATIEWRTAGTPFQRAVWAALTTIAPGQTLGYGALAARLGWPNAARAVGLANGSNPISLIVPCHRVIGADGCLTGYGGGIERKRWLLNHEGATFRDRTAQPTLAVHADRGNVSPVGTLLDERLCAR
jgi:methylated-DNA-[protein]-cysteine S-methyltransferase